MKYEDDYEDDYSYFENEEDTADDDIAESLVYRPIHSLDQETKDFFEENVKELFEDEERESNFRKWLAVQKQEDRFAIVRAINPGALANTSDLDDLEIIDAMRAYYVAHIEQGKSIDTGSDRLNYAKKAVIKSQKISTKNKNRWNKEPEKAFKDQQKAVKLETAVNTADKKVAETKKRVETAKTVGNKKEISKAIKESQFAISQQRRAERLVDMEIKLSELEPKFAKLQKESRRKSGASAKSEMIAIKSKMNEVRKEITLMKKLLLKGGV